MKEQGIRSSALTSQLQVKEERFDHVLSMANARPNKD